MLRSLLSKTRDLGISSHVVCLLGRGPLSDEIEELGVSVSYLGWKRGALPLLQIFELTRELRRTSPDLVQSWLYQSDFVAAISCLLSAKRFPLVWTVHTCSPDDRLAGWSTRNVRKLNGKMSRRIPSSIVYVSNAARSVHEGLGYFSDKGCVIPNGIDVGRFVPCAGYRDDIREELGLRSETPLVGMLARFDPSKDHRTFLSAANRVRAANPECHFVLAGNDVLPSNSPLMAMAREFEVDNCLHLLGRRDDTHRLHAAFDVEILASHAWEGFGLVVAEALACGVPCVVSDTGALSEVLSGFGEAVPEKDPVSMARACLAIMTLSRSERSEMCAKASQYVASSFSLENVAEQYVQLWGRLAARNVLPRLAS
ncbi:N,N'-diacetylbacillosaminyl-diphospho-undecaprenol alpha-1,3-N-acetylgalactosaminyltransferase [Rosistilla carotiformis]|uniref:N, N'-diacetylbacillosaminyl-diphospho-undecaprenol alpha-1,3-N-acetylgalactosaminyltransferase n=2 Tax=Rosistilla carotiformis TaxID=2528017 RepID=A0A518JP17_9BACT|nr:N,N'-diacetylbacillosaminyl-diphospho-undecaprenol alpha-1,3-N-acetylgalactosaminyltransferase [Rosistilla carotiformis]